MILISAALVGIGSSVFHPEASRVARMASGGRYGFAQSLFQLGRIDRLRDRPVAGGVHRAAARPGQHRVVLVGRAGGDVAADLCRRLVQPPSGDGGAPRPAGAAAGRDVPGAATRTVIMAMSVILILLFSKNIYSASLSSYYTFYLIEKFHVTVQSAQLHLFVFLGAVAAGTFAGGPIGDRFGRKPVIWFSILGAFPFALMLPYASLMWTGVLSVDHRPDHGLGVLGDHRLCAGTDAGPRRHGRRNDVRLFVRPWRSGRGGAWPDRRRHRDRVRVSGMLIPAGDRPADGVPAEHRGTPRLNGPGQDPPARGAEAERAGR